MLWQPPLPPRYAKLNDDQLAAAIAARKQELGRQLIILGHHYQQDDVIRFADFDGDSFKLSQLAAEAVEQAGARYVIFCGVHFMAESADILAPPGTAVILPDLSAGCSMADMADHDETVEAWQAIHEALADTDFGRRGGRVIPVCYMNSSAAIKAFCGEHGGAVCTSSNCRRVFEWALAGGTEPVQDGAPIKILFLPDQHLGRNTAAAMGYDVVTAMCVWDPKDEGELGGCDAEQLERSTFIHWKGHCSVHKLFRPEHIDQIRAQWPDVQVIVHPECCHEVVQKADMTGSTEGIRKTIESAKPGTRWAVGTEVHMVSRLARQAAERDVTVRILSDCQCLCTTMYRIDMPHMLWVLDNLAEGKVVNQIKVDDQVKRWSLVALNRMLELTGSGTTGAAQTPKALAGSG
jgi:quinolinate synthase